MNGFIDLPVGTEFGFNGTRYVVTPAPQPGRCEGCVECPESTADMDLDNFCLITTCLSELRHDKVDVIIVKKEEPNEQS